MISIGIITISDRSSLGLREDMSGPTIRKWAEGKGYVVESEMIVPDESLDIQNALRRLSDSGINLILTTGGTGCSPRDVTPEATNEVIEKSVPGLAEAMRLKSFEITPHALLSRAVAGIRKQCLIINLPGSPKAAMENLRFIEHAIPHAVDVLNARISDCGNQ